jgi:hypothetical protein
MLTNCHKLQETSREVQTMRSSISHTNGAFVLPMTRTAAPVKRASLHVQGLSFSFLLKVISTLCKLFPNGMGKWWGHKTPNTASCVVNPTKCGALRRLHRLCCRQTIAKLLGKGSTYIRPMLKLQHQGTYQASSTVQSLQLQLFHPSLPQY